jgi:hypothetical protein
MKLHILLQLALPRLQLTLMLGLLLFGLHLFEQSMMLLSLFVFL